MTLTDPTATRALFASRGAWVIAQDHVATVIGYRKAQRAQVIDGCGAFGRIITVGDVIHGDALIGGIAIERQRAGQGAGAAFTHPRQPGGVTEIGGARSEEHTSELQSL